MPAIKISPTLGHVISGVRLGDHEFEGRVMAAQLFQFAEDPRNTENEKVYKGNTILEEQRRLRLEVQRMFAGEKRKNAESYAEYIVNMHAGEPGLTPTMVLWTNADLDFEESEDGTGAARLLVPFTVRLIAIDGETQLAARYIARDINPDTAQAWVSLKICYNRDVNWARQVFHDLNVLGVQPNKALAIGMDARDPLTSVARHIEDSVPLFRGKINKQKRQLSASDRDIMTITTLRGACITLAEGIGGVKHGTSPVSIDKERAKHVEKVAVEFFNAVADKIGPATEDRERTVVASPAVMAAIGAMGNVLVGIEDDAARRTKLTEIVERLSLVNWNKGDHWAGIAGKFSPSGKFSLGGAKENSYAVYAALTDVTSDGYDRIRVSQKLQVA
ncbi:MAG: putative sulfur modification protein DndB [Gemmatimonadetes bacterium]|nr:putative sulfur modification protein DndB [Gemmatimonadota bacterium]